MEGFEDPFNRRTFPWGQENTSLLSWFSDLGRARKQLPALRRGDLRFLAADGSLLAFVRSCEGEQCLCLVNAGKAPRRISHLLPEAYSVVLCTSPPQTGSASRLPSFLPPLGGCLLRVPEP